MRIVRKTLIRCVGRTLNQIWRYVHESQCFKGYVRNVIDIDTI
jgi:hypothetical protein